MQEHRDRQREQGTRGKMAAEARVEMDCRSGDHSGDVQEISNNENNPSSTPAGDGAIGSFVIFLRFRVESTGK